MHPGVTGRKSGAGEPILNPAINDPILTEAEMAKRLRVSIYTLRRYRKAGKISFVRLTAHMIGYRQSHGDALIDANTVHRTIGGQS